MAPFRVTEDAVGPRSVGAVLDFEAWVPSKKEFHGGLVDIGLFVGEDIAVGSPICENLDERITKAYAGFREGHLSAPGNFNDSFLLRLAAGALS